MHKCMVCGKDIRLKRGDSHTCSGKCRQTLARRKKMAFDHAQKAKHYIDCLHESYLMGAINKGKAIEHFNGIVEAMARFKSALE